MKTWLANSRGFCAGVDRAVKVVEELLALEAGPVHVRHEIVHNRSVVDGLRAPGAVFTEAMEQVPDGAVAVVSAHGAPPPVFAEAASRGLRLFDATCPLVSRVHLEVAAHAAAGREVLLIGHRGLVEVEGTLGLYGNPAGRIQAVQDEAPGGGRGPPLGPGLRGAEHPDRRLRRARRGRAAPAPRPRRRGCRPPWRSCEGGTPG